MKRVLVDAIPEPGELVEPEAAECHHLLQVRRTGNGEIVEVLDGAGSVARGSIELMSRKQFCIRITERLEENRESSLHLEVAVAIPTHRPTFDQALPGLVQLGVRRIYLSPSEYSGSLKRGQNNYRKRLHEICRQSLKQCGRTCLPELVLTGSFLETCQHLRQNNERNLIFHPQPEARTPLPEQVDSLGLFIGPEGGFSDEEVNAAEGFRIVDLGPRILKLETALVGACFWAQKTYGDL